MKDLHNLVGGCSAGIYRLMSGCWIYHAAMASGNQGAVHKNHEHIEESSCLILAPVIRFSKAKLTKDKSIEAR